jgi:ERCC4-type nuclease
MKIIIDTREQMPLFPGAKQTLIVGDYTTKLLHNKFHIERKSLSDLYGTLTSGNQRFKRELFRAAYHRISIVVYVEGTLADFVNKRFPKGSERKYSSEGLEKLVATFERVYYLKFEWHRNRAECCKAVQKRLEQEELSYANKK